MTTRTKRITLWGIAALALIALAIPKMTYLKGNQSSTDAKQGAGARGGGGKSAPVAVTAYVVTPSRLADRIFVTGTVSANEQVDLQSEVPGKITRIFFREGTAVAKGTLLVKINDADLQAQLVRANYRKELAVLKEARQRQLREKDAVSQSEYDVALNDLNTSSADIALIRAQIAKTDIRAPFSGMIGLRNVSEGSYIAPSTKIVSLSNTNPVKIDFSVPEKYYSVVRPGSTISFTIQGSSGTYTGRVYAVEPKIDQATRTLLVRAVCSNGNGKIFPGAFAEIELTLKQIENTLMVPTEAVIPEAEGKKVFVSKEGKAESRKVEVGIRTDKNVQVLSGLAPGDTVITSGILQVKPGSALKISTIQPL
ncbi:MAG: efflux RND transporter periplasmic adaptor subunit [Candidatus Kapaibacterium sp.]